MKLKVICYHNCWQLVSVLRGVLCRSPFQSICQNDKFDDASICWCLVYRTANLSPLTIFGNKFSVVCQSLKTQKVVTKEKPPIRQWDLLQSFRRGISCAYIFRLLLMMFFPHHSATHSYIYLRHKQPQLPKFYFISFCVNNYRINSLHNDLLAKGLKGKQSWATKVSWLQ